MNHIKETLGSSIRKRRKELKLTAEELATRIQIDRTYLSKIERHNLVPSIEVLVRLNTILDLNRWIDSSIRNKINLPLTPEVFEKVYLEHTKSNDKITGLFWEQITTKKEGSDKSFVLKLLSDKYGSGQLQNKSDFETKKNKVLKHLKNWRKAYLSFIDTYVQAELKLIDKFNILA